MWFSLKMINFNIYHIDILAKFCRPRNLKEAADRPYIEKYISSCISYLPENPDILDFDEECIYANIIQQEKGGVYT